MTDTKLSPQGIAAQIVHQWITTYGHLSIGAALTPLRRSIASALSEQQAQTDHAIALLRVEVQNHEQTEAKLTASERRRVPAAQEGWQPIETAPKDGLSFLACSPASSTFLAHWANGVVDGASWTDEGGYEGRHATLWMPLPAPPVGLTQERRTTTTDSTRREPQTLTDRRDDSRPQPKGSEQ